MNKGKKSVALDLGAPDKALTPAKFKLSWTIGGFCGLRFGSQVVAEGVFLAFFFFNSWLAWARSPSRRYDFLD